MSPLLITMFACGGTLAALMVLLWLISLVRRDASLVDPFWGTGFIVVVAVAAALNLPVSSRGWLIIVLTTVWGLRLSSYLMWRNWGTGEDRRYAAMREHHGDNFWWVSLFTVFLLQATILWFVSLPLQGVLAGGSAGSPGWLDAAGAGVWLIGLIFEAGGDWQLARFKSDPANSGRVMDQGLWSLTRHPNYFGDFCIWWGLFLIAASGGAVWTIGSPLLMSILLLKFSGVSLLESDITERRPGYAEYQQRTNAFFPSWPRQK